MTESNIIVSGGFPIESYALADVQCALAHCQRGEHADAERLCRAILQADPDNFEAMTTLGVVAARTRRVAGAVALLKRALELRPDDAVAHNNYANILKQTQCFAAAIEAYRHAIRLKPDYVSAFANLGMLLMNMNRFEEALDSYDHSLAIRSDNGDAHFNRGTVLVKLERFDEALESFTRSLAYRPDLAPAHLNCGMVHHLKGHTDTAIGCYDQAVNLSPGFGAAHLNRAYAYLLSGDFERGWPEHEWRQRHPNFDVVANRALLAQAQWKHGSMIGKTLLIVCEQGLGDTLQFCRYAIVLARLGVRVILEVQKPLLSLLARLSQVLQVIARGDTVPPFDCYSLSMSLPFMLQTKLSTIPCEVPYVTAHPDKSRRWSEKLGARTRPRVGLVWSGEIPQNQFAVTSRRNVPLRVLATVLHPGIDFISLQKGQSAEAELVALRAADMSGAPPIREFSDCIDDFSDTAALIDNLDLVISVDTATAHLAGAMGKPVWILNRFDSCWRWLLDRDDSPWYPTAKIYRQARLADWESVMTRVRADLEQLLGS